MQKNIFINQGYVLIFFVIILQLNGCSTSISNDAGRTAEKVTAKSGISLACQAEVLRPAIFTPHREVIPIFEPAPEYKNTPAKIEWGSKRIQVAPARMSNETVPAQYQEVTETVTVLRERTELKGIPAVYKTIDRPVTIKPAHTAWKPGCVPQNRPADCFVPVAKQSRTLQQQIVDIPAKIVQKRLPAKTITIKKKVLIKPGQGTGKLIPPRYRDVKVGRVSQVWQVNATKPHARYEVVQVQKQERPEQIKQAATLCMNNTSPSEQVKLIQRRLQQRGLPLTISGNFDRQTWLALTQFQRANDLFIGAVTAETLNKLGL